MFSEVTPGTVRVCKSKLLTFVDSLASYHLVADQGFATGVKVQRPGARIESRDADEAGCGEGVSPSQVREGTVEIVFFYIF